MMPRLDRQQGLEAWAGAEDPWVEGEVVVLVGAAGDEDLHYQTEKERNNNNKMIHDENNDG